MKQKKSDMIRNFSNTFAEAVNDDNNYSGKVMNYNSNKLLGKKS